MCGIIGKFGGISNKDLLFYWEALSHRGIDSYGIMGIKKKNRKQLVMSKGLLEDGALKNQKLKNFRWILAHNRKASIGGAVSLKIAHPVGENGVYVIHNGTRKELYSAVWSSKSDTHAIWIIYSRLQDKNNIFDFLHGTGIVFIADIHRKKIFFHRDDSRTLYYCPERKLIASEPIDTGSWQMVEEQEKVFHLLKFEEEWDKKIKLNNKKITLKTMAVGVCQACMTDKILEEGKDICPDCEYQGKGKKVIGYRTVYPNYDYSRHF